MKKGRVLYFFYALGVALFLTCSTGVSVAESLPGEWVIKYFALPDEKTKTTRCMVFAKTGDVMDMPESGIVRSETRWDGEYIEIGRNVRWCGTTVDGGFALCSFGKVNRSGTKVRGNFEEFSTSSGTTSNAGRFIMRRKDCVNSNDTSTEREGSAETGFAQ